MTEHSKDTTLLNTLIGTLLDSVEGYRKSAGDVDRPELAGKFTDRANEREAAVRQLQAAVSAQGGNPEDDATTLGGVHRVWLGLKEAVMGKDDKAIVGEIERGEDYLKGKFEAALKADDLAPETRSAIQQAWESVRAGHDEMSALKHSMEGTR